MTVSFCGHRKIEYDEKLLSNLEMCVFDLVQKGATMFYIGGYGEFDRLAARAVYNIKKKEYPDIKSIFVTPYLNRDYDIFLYDEIVYPPLERVPLKYAIIKRNQCMVKNSDMLVAYIRHERGSAFEMLKYAKRNKKPIIRI